MHRLGKKHNMQMRQNKNQSWQKNKIKSHQTNPPLHLSSSLFLRQGYAIGVRGSQHLLPPSISSRHPWLTAGRQSALWGIVREGKKEE